MSLPPAAPQRQLKHRRHLDVQVFARDDGLWEVDATLLDTKTRVTQMADGPRPPGAPIHDMLLRLVVNRELDIVAAGSDTRAMPYPGLCSEHGDAYAQLVGLNLLKDDAGVKAALGARSHLGLQALHRSLTLEKLCGCYIVMLPCECRVETCELSLERHA
jgi:hypothetical protein